MKYLIVIPYVDQKFAHRCLKRFKISTDNVLMVDNSKENKGVAGSWNLGIAEMKKRKADWLVVMSSSMRFHKDTGGTDLVEHLEKRKGKDYVIHFCDKKCPDKNKQFKRGKTVGIESGNFSWHCTAISKEAITKLGKFDANFYPIYFEDIDYDLRIQKCYKDKKGWALRPINAYSMGVGNGVRQGKIKVNSTELLAYFCNKWGRHPSAPELGSYDTPFNEGVLAFWPPANGELWYDEKDKNKQ